MFRLNQISKKEKETNGSAPEGAAAATTEKKEESILGGNKAKATKKSAAEIRVQKDMTELQADLPPSIKIDFPDPANTMLFNARITPNEGLWANATYVFNVNVSNKYPYEAPKVLCKTVVYHPNIDWEGHVCLNILREDWKPVLNLYAVLTGVLYLFLSPNPTDPLNKEAAEHMINRKADFEATVKKTLRGGYHFGHQFPNMAQ